MRQSILFIALALVPANIQAQTVRPEVVSGTGTGNIVAPQFAVGGGWTTTILLMNLGISPATYTLQVYGDSGLPQPVSFTNTATNANLGTQSMLTGTLPVGGVASFKADEPSLSTVTGWASFSSSGGEIGAQVVYRYITGQEATALAETTSSTRFYLAFDNTNGNVTGVALVNPQSTAVTVTVQFRDPSGNPISSDQFTMAPLEHTSFILTDKYPALASQLGTALFTTTSTDTAIAAVGILSSPALLATGAIGSITTIFPLQAQ
jgi:hypothetical protein